MRKTQPCCMPDCESVVEFINGETGCGLDEYLKHGTFVVFHTQPHELKLDPKDRTPINYEAISNSGYICPSCTDKIQKRREITDQKQRIKDAAQLVNDRAQACEEAQAEFKEAQRAFLELTDPQGGTT